MSRYVSCISAGRTRRCKPQINSSRRPYIQTRRGKDWLRLELRAVPKRVPKVRCQSGCAKIAIGAFVSSSFLLGAIPQDSHTHTPLQAFAPLSPQTYPKKTIPIFEGQLSMVFYAILDISKSPRTRISRT